ncbi:MAG TPA: DUF551 domain-containing protein [Verrucomicrobiae bacterium]|nr:DUF551 domain-containing protein [Verrucomicrobiae bacterium]
MYSAPSNSGKNGNGEPGWISCEEQLPSASQFVMYRTPKYQALGKLERQQWYYSGFSLEPEENPVLCWQPLA